MLAEVYVLMFPRVDRKLPTIDKAWMNLLFYDLDDAFRYKRLVKENLGEDIGVFAVHANVLKELKE